MSATAQSRAHLSFSFLQSSFLKVFFERMSACHFEVAILLSWRLLADVITLMVPPFCLSDSVACLNSEGGALKRINKELF